MKKIFRKSKKTKELQAGVVDETPNITNKTVAEHREEVLSSARKYIYPLQHSKHKIVIITTSLFIILILGFFSFTMVSLYKLKSYSSFLYGVTKVLPLPIAKAGPDYVAYENYLFELKHYIHYYKNQQKLDFKEQSGQQQLNEFKKRALEKVINDAYIKQIAKEKHVSVSNQEVEDRLVIERNQNRLGGSDKVFEDVLKEYWGWSVSDFKRSLRQQILTQKLLPVLDPAIVQKANSAKDELNKGVSFTDVAKKYSDDAATKATGGDYGYLIDKSNRDISSATTTTLFNLKKDQVSDVINAGYSLEIVKVIEIQGDKVKAAHITFNFKDINSYLNDYKDKHKARQYIRL